MSNKEYRVFTNGCFDILHRAHMELFKFCKTLKPSMKVKLMVGLNSDASVKRLKGENRPINCQEDRKFLLESCRYIDEVYIFNEDTPHDLIRELDPDAIVKGGDYKPENVSGGDLCQVIIFDYIDGYSTTKAIKNLDNR